VAGQSDALWIVWRSVTAHYPVNNMPVSNLRGDKLDSWPLSQSPLTTIMTVDWETVTVGNAEVAYSDEYPIRCRTCRDHGRTPGTMAVLSRINYPDGYEKQQQDGDIHGLPYGSNLPIVLICPNAGCDAKIRIRQAEVEDRYEMAVEKRLGIVWI
jgi:hypothetical protein